MEAAVGRLVWIQNRQSLQDSSTLQVHFALIAELCLLPVGIPPLPLQKP